MKNLISIFLIILFSISAGAQTTQKGIIKEYNEKAKKTPLGGVELNVRSANSTVSDNNGNFILKFVTLKPGEKVNIRRIEKLGYEIFNKEAVEQWNINPDSPFVIVMCRSDRFKIIRDNYEKISSASYARQLKKEEAAIAKMKLEGKIKDIEYQKKLVELRENYEKQLDNLEHYIDRFSRIDLSELSAVEQEIIALVQEGRIDEAILKYEEQGYVDKFTKEVSEIKEISSSIDQLSDVKRAKEASRDSLLAAIDRQIETMKLAGGKENFDKTGVILSELVASDKQNKHLLWKYITFLDSQSLALDLDSALTSYLALPLTDEEKIEALRLQIKTKINVVKYEEAEPFIDELLVLISESKNQKITDTQVSDIFFTIGGMYMDSKHPELAIPYIRKAMDTLSYQGPDMDIKEMEIWLKSRIGMGYIAYENADKDLFVDILSSTYSIVDSLINNNYPFDSYPNIFKCLVDLGQLEELYQDYGKAVKLYDYAESHYLTTLNDNPIRIKPAYINLLMAKAILLQKKGEYKESEKEYLKALSLIEEMEFKSPRKYLLLKEKIYNNLSLLYLKTTQLEKALNAAKSSYDIILGFYSETPFYNESLFRSSNISLARVYEAMRNYDEAEKYYLEAYNIDKKIYEERGAEYKETYWRNLIDPAIFYTRLGHEEMGLPYYEELVKIGDGWIKEGSKLYDAYKSFKLFLLRGYRKAGEYAMGECAIEDYLRVNPQNHIGLLEAARIKTLLGKTVEAQEFIEQALKYNPEALDNLTENDIIWTVYKK